MFISLSTWLYDYLPLEEMIKKVKECGYKNIEVSGISWPKKWSWKNLVQTANKKKIKIVSVHCTHHEIPEEKMNEKLFVEYHQKFYQKISGFSGLIIVEHTPMGSFQDMKGKTLTQLNILKELASQYRLTLSLENVPGTSMERPEEAKYFLKDSLPFTFDAAHAAYIDIEPMQFKPLFPQVVNIHVYDVDKEIGLGLGDWLPPQLGRVNWKKIIAGLRKVGYQGPLTVELNERRLKKVFLLCQRVILSSGMKISSSLLNWNEKIDDLFAIYSRRYLEDLIKQGK